MPLIPLRQTIVITKAAASSGWGLPSAGAVLTLKARVSEQTRVVTNQAGEEAVTSMTIYLDKLADITYDDAITYTNELGVSIKRYPVSIVVKRGMNGKAILTEVSV